MLVDSQSFLLICLILSLSEAQDHWISSEDKCGQVWERTQRDVPGVHPSPAGSSPWHATIYRVPSDPSRKLIQICGGTVLTKYHIITAASCIYINGCIPVDPKLYRVVVAQTHKRLEVDPDAQIRQVKFAKANVGYDGENLGYVRNIAIFYLDEPLILNDYVMPICIDQDPTRSRQLPAILEAAGWGFDSSLLFSESLNEAVFSTLESKICRGAHRRFKKYINFDKFCIETPKGTIAEDTGTGLVTKIGRLYYLKGVLSVQVDKSVAIVTFLFRYYEWLKSAMIRIEDEKKCDGKFPCRRGPCIDTSMRCNRIDNCPDASDEEDCDTKCVGTLVTNNTQRYTPTVTTTKCTIPSQIGGASYVLNDCRGDSCVRRFGTELEDGEKIKMTCGEGTAPPDRYDPIYVCTKGKWFPEAPVCQTLYTMVASADASKRFVDNYSVAFTFHHSSDGRYMWGGSPCGGLVGNYAPPRGYSCHFFKGQISSESCPMKTKKSLHATCEYNRVPINCTAHLKPGTVVTYGCQQLYKFKDALPYPRINCLEGGKWSENPPECIPECGIRNNMNLFEPTITYGRNATTGEFPWHVALYGRRDASSTDWEYRCGGTILYQTNIVLTAAHCVFMDELGTKLMEPAQLWVAAGRVKRSLQIQERNEQFSGVSITVEVKKIIPHSEFIGSRGKSALANDIALVVLESPLNVTDFVLPCCLGLDFTASTTPNQKGTVVGWGFTEKGLQSWGKRGIASNDLLYTQLPLINNQECRSMDEKAKYIVAPDKFCGLYSNESGPQQGDSGGGLVIEFGPTYQIIGIVSSKPTGSHKYGTFTSIGSHKAWLVENMRDVVDL